MQVVDKDGNIFGAGLQVNGPDGKPKTSSGGGTPSGPAGGDLSGTYPNPSVTWANGVPTYDLQYYPLSLNPANYLTSITAADITAALGYTPYSDTNPAGYIDSFALTPYLTSASAASTYYPLTNPSGYITSAALSGYLTAATAASTYYPIPTGTTAQYIRGDGTFAAFPTIPTVTPSALTKVDDTNVTLTLGGTPASALLQSVSLTLGWTGTLADSRIASASTWNAKQNAITLTTTGTSGAATLVGSTLNIPQYGGSSSLTIGTTAIASGTVGRILFEGTGNVLQESANLFWDNTNSRLGIGTATPSATLHSVGSITASGAIARGNYMQPTLVAAANNDTLIGLDIAPTFTNGAFTSVTNMLLNMSSPSVSGASIFVNKYAYNNGWIINIKNGSTNQTGDIFQSYGLELGSSNTNIGGILKGKWGVGYNGATSSVPVTLSVNGSVGIGITTDAGYKLDVNGSTRVQGDITIGSGNGFLRGTVNVVSLFSATDQVTVFSSNRGALSGTLGYFGVTELKPSGGIAQSSIGIGQTNAFVAISQGNVSNTNAESFVVNRGFFGNVVATTKNILNVSSTLNSNLTNATLLRGIYIDINNTTTFTGFTDFRAIESIRGGAYFNTSSVNASAILQADSTTKGFLPPRMTTAQKTAIASPAAGLVVYDTTLNKLCVYTTAWETITSI